MLEEEKKLQEIHVAANVEELDSVLDAISEKLMQYACPKKIEMQIRIAVEEMFVNVAHYAYQPEEGEVCIRYGVLEQENKAMVQLIDGGVPYNPLLKTDPDVTLDAEDRAFGGLGIYMVKKSMSEVSYQYLDGKNIFTMIKNLI